jgi:endonuclease/exonuclease/phosphatase family metal-dependent hydrolase
MALILCFFSVACQGPSHKGGVQQRNAPDSPPPVSFGVQEKKTDELSLLTLNVENLFDGEDNEGVNDETYLPLAMKQNPAHQQKCQKISNDYYRKECLELDWNDQVIHQKMKNLAEVILALDGGRGPDIVLLQEVENKNVLSKLNKIYLPKAQYKTVVLEPGFDPRGINVALLSKLPLLGKPQLHRIPFSKENEKTRTRGLLEVHLLSPGGREIVVFVGHFPSQSNPTSARREAHQFLLRLMNKQQGKMVIAGGDFNTTAREEQSFGYFSKIYQKSTEPGNKGYLVSHLFGCFQCLGTHFYKNEWGFLDALIFPQNKENLGFEILPEHIDVIRSYPLHVDAQSIPKRFDPESLTGVSDHLPLYLRMRELRNHQ